MNQLSRQNVNKCNLNYLGHFLVWDKELLVLRVLEVIFLNISPELLNAFSSAGLFFANNVSELRAELHRFGKSGSLRHFEELLSFVLSKDWKILQIKAKNLLIIILVHNFLSKDATFNFTNKWLLLTTEFCLSLKNVCFLLGETDYTGGFWLTIWQTENYFLISKEFLYYYYYIRNSI